MRPRNDQLESTAHSTATADSGKEPLLPAGHPGADPNRVQRIQQAAYRRAQERGFSPGAELDDWLAAERQIDEELNPVATGHSAVE